MQTNNYGSHALLLIIFFVLIPSYITKHYQTEKLLKKSGGKYEKEVELNDKSTTQYQENDKGEKYNTANQVQMKNKNVSGAKKECSKNNTFDHSLFLDAKKKEYFVQWKINETHITFDVQVKTLGWVGLGLAPSGGMPGADIAVMWIEDGKLTLQDRFAEGYFEPLFDEPQDWIPLYGYENGTHTIVGFSRLLDTCDEKDRKITEDTVHLLYAYHSKDPPNGQLMKHEVRGQRSVAFKNVILEFPVPEYTKKLTIKTNKYEIPSENVTTYRCFLSQLKDIDKTYYMVASNAVISPETVDVTHHILLHLCDSNFHNPKNVKDILCLEDNHSGEIMRKCYSQILVVWAVGGDSIIFPKDVGFPIDKSMNNRWLYLEVHYNNLEHAKGLIDDSAIDLYLTDKPPKYEAGQLFFGLFDFTWGLMIPPKQKEYTFTTYCSQHCMSNMEFPEDGMNVFFYFLHTHLAGKSVRIKIIRDGKELKPVMRDDNYDFNFQIYRQIPTPIKIMKGDSLVLECTYTTMDRENYTIGGFQTFEEMCLAYVYYYPKSNFNLCGTVPSTPSLVKALSANVPMNKIGLSEMIYFQRDPLALKHRDILMKQMNTNEWKSEEGVKKLKDIYKNLESDEICRYMGLPEIGYGKIPKYKPYKEKPSTCVNGRQ